MDPGLLFVTLLGLTFTAHGQTPPPERPSITTPFPNLLPEDLLRSNIVPLPDNVGIEPTLLEVESAVKEAKPTEGNIQVMNNDQLRDVMKTLDITQEEIRELSDLYTRGGSPTITKARKNSKTGLQETITLDFEQFFATTPSGDDVEASPSTSVSQNADTLPGQPATIVKSGDGPRDASPSRENTLVDLQDAVDYLQNQLRELDSQLLILDNAYRSGQITRFSRNYNVLGNRERHYQLESDLRTLQREITRLMTPQAQRTRPREVVLGSGLSLPINPQNTDIRRLERGNQILEQHMKQSREDWRSATRNVPLGAEELLMHPVFVPRPAGTASLSYEALIQQLIRIRAQERYILRRLQMLSTRNSRLLGRGRLPTSRNVFLGRRTVTRRINVSNTPRFSHHRTSTGSIDGGNARNYRLRLL